MPKLKKKRKRKRQLNCRPGYIQRGAACQPERRPLSQTELEALEVNMGGLFRKKFNPRRSPINDSDLALAERLEKEGGKKMAGVTSQLKSLDRESNAIQRDFEREVSAIQSEFSSLSWRDRSKRYVEVQNRLLNVAADAQTKEKAVGERRVKVMGDLRDRLLSESKISAKQARDKSEQTEIVNNVRVGFPDGYTVEQFRSDMADVHRLSGGEISTLKRTGYAGPRPWASEVGESMNVGSARAYRKNTEQFRADIYHEMGHHSDFSRPDIGRASNAWMQRKATLDNGGKLPRPQTLKQLTGLNYHPSERAYKDSYVDPYVGKIYKKLSHQTEVTSMGFQHFSSPSQMARLWRGDPAHFKYMVGVIGELNR